MIAYFIDVEAPDKKKKKQLDRLDLLMTQKGVSGRKYKLGPLHDLKKSVEESINSGARTIVGVGGDSIVNRLANTLLTLSEEASDAHVRLASIPIGDKTSIARSLNIKNIEDGVGAIAHEHVKKIDVGLINKRHYFVHAAVFPAGVALDFASYKISSLRKDHHISVCNGPLYGTETHKGRFSDTDGVLEAVVAYRPTKKIRSSSVGDFYGYIVESVFPIRKINITTREKTLGVVADVEKRMSVPVAVEVVPRALNVLIAASK